MSDEEYLARLMQLKLRQPHAPRNEHAAARIRGFTEGLTGSDDPSGVLDNPQYAEDARAGHRAGSLTGLASDAPIPPLSASKAVLLAGLLRKPSGMKTYITHGQNAESFLNDAYRMTKTLDFPSLAVRYDKPHTDIGNATFLASERKLAERERPNKLFDKDAFTTTRSQMEEAKAQGRYLDPLAHQYTPANELKSWEDLHLYGNELPYAELKMGENLPLDAEHFPALLMKRPDIWSSPAHTNFMKLEAKNRGMKVIDLPPKVSDEELRQMYEYAQKLRAR